MCEKVRLAGFSGKGSGSGDEMLWEDGSYVILKKASQIMFPDSF